MRHTIKEGFEIYRERKERKQYENIDFDNIASVTFDGTMPAYRIETEEEFDIVNSTYLTDLDGWQHYETETVEYEVPDGNDYCFTIRYKNGTEIYRKFHESSPITAKLLAFKGNIEISEDGSLTIESYGHVVINREE